MNEAIIVYLENGKLIIKEISAAIVKEVVDKLTQSNNEQPRATYDVGRDNYKLCRKCGEKSEKKLCSKCNSARVRAWQSRNKEITKCIDCGCEISYYGKKPKRCKACLCAAKSRNWRENNPRRNKASPAPIETIVTKNGTSLKALSLLDKVKNHKINNTNEVEDEVIKDDSYYF